MKTKTANSRRLDILGNVNRSSDQEIFTAALKQWRQKLAYCSLFAAIPALLDVHVPVVHSDEAKQPEASVAGPTTRLLKRLDQNRSNPALLKRQSEFLLPHQKGSFDMTTLGGNDDCPGRAIPGGSYTAAAPYIDSGDTTGANDTVSYLNCYYGYYGYNCVDALGPDLVYTFTVTGLGPNPQIQVSTTSGTYRPLIYVLGGSAGACPSGIGNHAHALVIADSRSTTGSTATLNSAQMNQLPLNVPLYLFVDSALNDANGSGPYTIRIQDVTIAPANSANQIDDAQFFVRQQYLDFLNREPDQGGWDYWTAQITQCGDDALCIHNRRVGVSDAFFFEPEFHQTAAFVFLLDRAAYGDNQPFPLIDNANQAEANKLPNYDHFVTDRAQVVGGSNLAQSQLAFATLFVSRPEFTARYDPGLTGPQFVDALLANVFAADIVDLSSQRQALIDQYDNAGGGNAGRAQVMYLLALDDAANNPVNNRAFIDAEYNRQFALNLYFGYLRRNPDIGGFLFWQGQINSAPVGDVPKQQALVCSFITSAEYQLRFGSIVTHTNAECPQ